MHAVTKRRVVIATVAAALVGLSTPCAMADDSDWPNHTISFVSGFPGGAATDIYSRKLGVELADRFKVSVITDNRTGAGGNIASGIVAQARPDGYTFLLATAGTHAINATLYRKLGFDVVKDFTPIALLGDIPNFLLINPVKHPDIKTCADLLRLLRANPGTLNYSSTGNGTSGHLAGVQFAAATQTDAVHVPYRGQGPAMTALLGGEVDFFFNQSAPSIPMIKSGKVRGLAVTSPKPIAVMPDVPPVADACELPGFNSTTWFAIFGPPNLPAPIRDKMSEAIVSITHTAAFRQWLAGQGITPIDDAGPAALQRIQEADIKRWGDVVRKSGAQVD